MCCQFPLCSTMNFYCVRTWCVVWERHGLSDIATVTIEGGFLRRVNYCHFGWFLAILASFGITTVDKLYTVTFSLGQQWTCFCYFLTIFPLINVTDGEWMHMKMQCNSQRCSSNTFVHSPAIRKLAWMELAPSTFISRSTKLAIH